MVAVNAPEETRINRKEFLIKKKEKTCEKNELEDWFYIISGELSLVVDINFMALKFVPDYSFVKVNTLNLNIIKRICIGF